MSLHYQKGKERARHLDGKASLLRHLSLPVHLASALKAAEVLLSSRLLGLHERLLDKATDVLFFSSPTYRALWRTCTCSCFLLLFSLFSLLLFLLSCLPQSSSSHNLTDWREDHSLLCACFQEALGWRIKELWTRFSMLSTAIPGLLLCLCRRKTKTDCSRQRGAYVFLLLSFYHHSTPHIHTASSSSRLPSLPN